jgi:PKD-like family
MKKVFSGMFGSLVLLTMLLAGCYKDKGNYEYTEPNKISFAGIDPSYVALLGEKLAITPTLSFTTDASNDTSHYKYEWIALRTDNVLPADVKKELAFSRNLDITVTIPPGPYRVYYRVTDKKTGIQFQHTFNLSVQSTVFEGWMLMCDVNGKARVDMLSKVSDTETRILVDVLKFTGSDIPGKYLEKPVMINCYSYDPTMYGIYVSTSGGTTKIHPETFKWLNTYDIKYEFVGQVKDDFVVDYMTNLGGNRAYCHGNDDNIYYYYRVQQIRYSTPINLVKGEANLFKAYKEVAASSNAAILYDMENKRFVRHVNNEGTSTLMPAGTLFNYDKVGSTMKYMAMSSYNGGNVFAVMQNDTTNKYKLARIAFGTAINQVYYAEMNAIDIEKAKTFAVDPTFGYVYYAVDGKVYSYDFNLKASKLMLDLGNREVTLLDFSRGTLNVFSYSQAEPGTSGILETFTTAAVQGAFTKTRTVSGFGKVVSASYRAR